MLVAKNNFLVEVESQFLQPEFGGVKFFLDTDFNPQKLSTRIGKIHSESIQVTAPNNYDVKLKTGDNVVFNHNVCLKANMVSENVFMCAYNSIYAKVSAEKVQPLEDIFFCEPITEPDIKIGFFEVKGAVSDKFAKVVYISEQAKSKGLKEGDIVWFTKNADYSIDVLGRTLYKMHLRNIICIERDGELKPFGKKLIVKNITTFGSVGAIEKIYATSNLQTGVVVESTTERIQAGQLVTYFPNVSSEVTFKGVRYSFIAVEAVKYIV